MRKNAVLFLIDGLRYDVFADVKTARVLFPNLVSLIDRGFIRRAIANAPSTQMVMPSLFSLTYPLDHGGYNTGIRNRPKSFPELLKAAGYSTQLMASCNQLGTWLGYGRGFDGIHTTFDCRHILEYLIDKTLRYDVNLWKSGKRSEAETIEIIRRELSLIIDGIESTVRESERFLWPPRLLRINERVAAGCAGERELLKSNPRAVLEKLASIRPIFYWRYMGRARPGKGYFFYRLVESMRWRSRAYLIRWRSPFMVTTHFETKAHEIVGGVCQYLPNAKRPWYLHTHLMDVHDCCSISRFGYVLRYMRFLPVWLRERFAGRTRRRFNYDLSLMFVDAQLGKLLSAIRRLNLHDDTVILVTGDHGSPYPESPRERLVVGARSHYEHIDVPIIVAGAGRQPSDIGLTDTMGVAATLLDILDVPADASFKGRSIFGPGRTAIISENAGAGNADLARKDLYFAVTTSTHRMMTVLRGNRIEVTNLYDLKSDPLELRNLRDNPDVSPVVNGLLQHIYAERGELLAMRGVVT